ncbi:MAG: DinB family protein [Saprospirales bacterium]|nr:DinB family protein [Saprospirales bacterium]
MKKIIQELETAITKYYALLKETNDENFSKKPALNKWSKQEELGHLIDSAQNNIQRFIRVQHEENVHIRYHPDNWVAMNNYQNIEKNDVVELWYLLNKQIIAILEKMPSDKQEALMSFDVNPANKNTTLFIAEDYVQHLTHHLENIVSK